LRKQLQTVADYYNADLNTPWNELPDEFRHAILYGSGGRCSKLKHTYI